MLPRFRPATPNEIEQLAPTSDLGPTTSVLALDNPQGGTNFVVLRQCLEADPVVFDPQTTDRQKAMMFMILENMLAFAGQPAYYFNIHADEEFAKWREVVKTFGAVQVSTAPEFRYKRDLINVNKDPDKQ